ncbi:MFS transporter [Xenorhabdus thuongxuanensis]|uniref:Arabinose ABC transporter permease n=1 Tax=Xenorhabdus thuongxuanensis TaxID=1873484 RepID=A0A1Q5U7L8_9GAMM|nr:MFS transporter [Xenorhabdus thuongxuanensis]OKP08490.1 arabinose ABC transporter permease [Xenorhabdus thuongxuanensis]
MFSSFSYIADYLAKITQFNKNSIGIILILFGICGFIGNFIFSGLLQKNVVMTIYAYPILLIILYLQIFWGGLHSAGLVVSQTWLLREANEAPEFANSFYISFSNLGITIGYVVGGWFLAQFGVHAIFLSSILFSLIAFFSIYLKN